MGEGKVALLLDTCALIYLADGQPMKPDALERIDEARARGGVLVSPVSAWEIGLLTRPGRTDGYRFAPDPKTWFASILAAPGVRIAPLECGVALDASALPGRLHGDPADRLLVATARRLAVPIVTRDKAILDYADDGHVEAVRC